MDAPPPAVRFSLLRSLAYSALIVGTFFGLVELSFRLLGLGRARPVPPTLLVRLIDTDIELPFMRPDAELFWSPRPGFRGEFQGQAVTINELGLRGRPLDARGHPGRRRVVCFGDSITFGYGVGDDDTYARRMGERMAERGTEVVNAGITGYTSHQVLGLLRRLTGQIRLNVATFCVGWNDSNRRPVTDQEYARRHRQLQRAEGVLDHSALFRALQGFRQRSLVRLPSEPATMRVPIDQYVRNLETMVAECRARGIRPVFVALPHRRGPRERPFPTDHPAALVAAARRLGVPLVPVGLLGLESTLPDTGEYFIDALHFSPRGHDEMARLLAAELARLGLV